MSLWNKVWSLNVPSKAKHLVWRICNDLLPEYRYIKKREVPADDSCFAFDGRDDDVTHTLFKCEYARMVWFACPLGLKVDDIIVGSLSESVSVLCSLCDNDTLALWSMVAWGLWLNRNMRCETEGGYGPLKLVRKVLKELRKFQNRHSDVRMIESQVVQEASWVAPPIGWVKVNCHLSHFRSEGTFIGCVIRDDIGDVLGSFTDILDMNNGWSVMEAQEITAYKSLLFAFKMGFRLIILESDYLDVVEKLQSIDWETTPIAKVRVGRKTLCPKDYDVFVCYIERENNQLATSVARHGLEDDRFKVWIEGLPPGVTNVDVV